MATVPSQKTTQPSPSNSRNSRSSILIRLNTVEKVERKRVDRSGTGTLGSRKNLVYTSLIFVLSAALRYEFGKGPLDNLG
jgi:hypothetical protein